MTWREALSALQAGDSIVDYTRTVVRLNPADEWTHFVSLALWECRRRLARMTAADRPDAYVRRVAQSMRRNDEQQLFGKHPVYDESGSSVIGHVTVGSYYNQRGEFVEPNRGGGLGFVPLEGVDGMEHSLTPQERRVREANAKPMVPALDADERAYQAAQRQGLSRRDIPAMLGWTRQRANRVYMRLYRRCNQQPLCMH